MKFTQSEALESLKTFIPNAEIVDSDSDYNKDEFLNAVDESRKPILRSSLEAEFDVKKAEEIGKLKAKHGGTIKSMLAREYGIKRSDLDKYETDDEAIKAAIAYHNSLLEGEKIDQKANLDALIAAHQKETDELKLQNETALKAAVQRYKNRDIDADLSEKLKDVPFVKNADRNALAKLYKEFLATKLDLDFDDESNSTVFLDKTSKQKALNEKKTDFVKATDFIEDFFKPLGVLETDMSRRNPTEELGKQGQEYQPGQPQKKNLNPTNADKNEAFHKQMVEQLQAAAGN